MELKMIETLRLGGQNDQFKSALVLKDKIFLPDYDSHDKMLQELGIENKEQNEHGLDQR